ncbi:MAG: hypothetical protein N4A62_10945 [Marinisporobacter sp.]|jgi:hypothetical protein|nr:hypothetical protein [Marinisporobacter sp.]
MKYSTISQDFFDKYSFDGDELIHNKDQKRPYAIILRLKFKGEKYTFALPFRSHIKSYVDKDQYFKLPPNRTTLKGEIHGLHYLKMFPIQKKYMVKYRFEDSKHTKAVLDIINRNEKHIVSSAQAYLYDYEANGRSKYRFGVDIEGLIDRMKKEQETKT